MSREQAERFQQKWSSKRKRWFLLFLSICVAAEALFLISVFLAYPWLDFFFLAAWFPLGSISLFANFAWCLLLCWVWLKWLHSANGCVPASAAGSTAGGNWPRTRKSAGKSSGLFLTTSCNPLMQRKGMLFWRLLACFSRFLKWSSPSKHNNNVLHFSLFSCVFFFSSCVFVSPLLFLSGAICLVILACKNSRSFWPKIISSMASCPETKMWMRLWPWCRRDQTCRRRSRAVRQANGLFPST